MVELLGRPAGYSLHVDGSVLIATAEGPPQAESGYSPNRRIVPDLSRAELRKKLLSFRS